jgi:hypothetical protein
MSAIAALILRVSNEARIYEVAEKTLLVREAAKSIAPMTELTDVVNVDKLTCSSGVVGPDTGLMTAQNVKAKCSGIDVGFHNRRI